MYNIKYQYNNNPLKLMALINKFVLKEKNLGVFISENLLVSINLFVKSWKTKMRHMNTEIAFLYSVPARTYFFAVKLSSSTSINKTLTKYQKIIKHIRAQFTTYLY